MRFSGLSTGRLPVACLLLLGLVGCVTVPRTELEADAARRVHSIALLKVSEPKQATVMNMGGVSAGFGLVGGLIQASVDSTHSKTYTQLLADRRFSFSQPMADAIIRSLRSGGYEVDYLSDQSPKLASDGKSDDFSDIHTNADAILVVWYTVVGYVSPPHSTKYEPWVGVRARLLDAKTKRDLYFKTFSGGYENVAKNVINLPADARYQFSDFDELTLGVDTSVDGMAASIDTIAAYIGHDFAQVSSLAGRQTANMTARAPTNAATALAPAGTTVPNAKPASAPGQPSVANAMPVVTAAAAPSLPIAPASEPRPAPEEVATVPRQSTAPSAAVPAQPVQTVPNAPAAPPVAASTEPAAEAAAVRVAPTPPAPTATNENGSNAVGLIATADLHTQPTFASAVTAALPAGTRVTVNPRTIHNKTGDWCYVKSTDQSGWITMAALPN